jgi:4,5-dihydroxyphthalate decarboxylase
VNTRLKLTLACTEADQTRDLTQGTLEAEGIELAYLPLGIPEMFHRFIVNREFDVSECSFGRYLALRAQGDTSLSALPVFLSRIFRQSALFVKRGSAIRKPEDLRGRRIGIPDWAQTAVIYARGFLAHEYGVGIDAATWVIGGVSAPALGELVDVRAPAGAKVECVRDRSLDAMLQAGEIDALITASPPPSFEQSNPPPVVRLFEDYRPVEAAYFRKTGVFPIMHVLAMQTKVLDEHPWVARSLCKAFEEAKRRSLKRFENASVACFPLPWVPALLEDARRELGGDWWPYGLEANRPTLGAFVTYAHEQGVTSRRLTPDELFPEMVLNAYTI